MTYEDKQQHMLNLSTKVAPPKTFLVDEEEFKLFGFEHLGKAQEASVSALFARYAILNGRLATASSKERGEKIAGLLYDIRIQIMCTLTDMPRELAQRLPMGAQVKLLNAIRSEVGGLSDADVDDEEVEPDELGDERI